MQIALDNVNAVMREYLAGIRVVKAFNRFNYERKRFKAENQTLKDETLRGTRTIALFNPMVGLVINIGVVIILWVGGIKVNVGNLEVGKVIAFVNYTSQVHLSLRLIAMMLNRYIRAKASAERIGEVFKIKGEVEFRKVSFEYKKGEEVLKNISFKVEAGTNIALVGPTGAGKTTIVNLLTGFYEIDKGEILIDGINIKDYKKDSLRRMFGMVLQDTYLFSGTIKDNIRYGRLIATDEEVEKTAQMSRANEFIERLPKGYNTMLMEGGINLSQGQRQLLAIARAILANPAILILDEATSNVDTRTELKIQEAMINLMKERTTFIIAHRLSTIRDADIIMVINEGKIVEKGNHEELHDYRHLGDITLD